MKDYNKNEAKVKSPALAYPELVAKLALISSLAYDLHEQLDHHEVARVLGVSQQAFSYQVKKVRKEKAK